MTKEEIEIIYELSEEEIRKNFNYYNKEIKIKIIKEKFEDLAKYLNEDEFLNLILPEHFVPSKEQIAVNGRFFKYLENPSEEFKLKAIEVNPYVILHMGMPSKEAINLALKDIRFQDAKILMKIIGEQSQESLKEMINSRGCVIEILDKPNYELRLEALKVNGLLIRHEENPNLEMKKVALNNNGLALEYIENPSEELCIIALRSNSKAFKFIKNPTEEMIILAGNK